MYPVAMFFNGELEMGIVCILGIYFTSKRQVPIDVAVTAHQVPNCIQLEQCEQSFLLKETHSQSYCKTFCMHVSYVR